MPDGVCPDCKRACDLAKENRSAIASLGRTVRGDVGEGNHGVLGELARMRKTLWGIAALALTAAIPGADAIVSWFI